jgi:CBS domain containing-hemolysin-like protein
MLDLSSGLITCLILLAINSLLAAARSALVNASHVQLRQMAEQGVGGAALALRVAEDATPLLATLRFAQTFCRFGVAGLVALLFAPRVADFLRPSLFGLQADTLAFVMLLLLGTMIIISIGEFLPEALALRAPENTAITFAPLVAFLEWLFEPVVRLSMWLSMRVAAPVAGQRMPLVTEEEIKTLVDAGEEGGAIEEDEKEMIYSIFEISQTWAREIMVPRIDVLALEVQTPLPEAVGALIAAGHSRVPVYEGTIDNVLGVLYAKDLLRLWRASDQIKNLRDVLRPAYFIPETKKVNELLTELQQKRIHMALVVDEYGGTAGIVTLEDIVEEIIGDIRDEYDVNEESYIERVSDTEYVFDARIDLDEVNELLALKLPSEDSDSLGGFIYGQLGHVPVAGEKVSAERAEFEVLSVTGRRIHKVRAVALPPPEPPPPEPPRRTGLTKPLAPIENSAHEQNQ